MTDVLYRAEVHAYDDYSVHVTMLRYPIVRRTRCGVWINTGYMTKLKFVNLQANKKWACESEDDAMVSLMRRKIRHVAILRAQLECATVELNALKAGATSEKPVPVVGSFLLTL